ncbi:MAG: hypothetical protein Q7V01_06065, partial [Vicinamibacterales bacterium]|nr:hypothetical protein [Vicinamibacterales bacterium]
ACARVVRAPLANVHAAINDVLSGLGWPSLESMPHIMTLPRDRVYSYDERIAIYARDAEARAQSPTA